MTDIRQQIYDALLVDPDFVTAMPSSTHAHWRSLCEKTPEILGEDLLAKLVTPTTWAEMKIVMLKFMIKENWVVQLIRLFPEEQLGNLRSRRGRLIAMAEQKLPALVRQLESMIPDMPGFIASQGIDEKTFFAHPNGGNFRPDTLKRWEEGTLTVESLLISQPNVLFKND